MKLIDGDRLIEVLGIEGADKHQYKTLKDGTNAFSTLMKYEILQAIEDSEIEGPDGEEGLREIEFIETDFKRHNFGKQYRMDGDTASLLAKVIGELDMINHLSSISTTQEEAKDD